MYPVNALTETGLQDIQDWIWLTNKAILNKNHIKTITLKEWNKNKIKLFKLFNNQLRIKIPYTRQLDTDNLYNVLSQEHFFPYLTPWTIEDYILLYKKNLCECWQNMNGFEKTVLSYFFELLAKNLITTNELCDLSLLFQKEPLSTNSINSTLFYNFDTQKHQIVFKSPVKEKELRIARNTKNFKAIRKILDYYDFPHMEDFQKWTSTVSTICTNKTYTTNLVLSIHPIDFMTVSDNDAGWTSCMNWRDNGAYSSGTIEMMNSNMVIVAYLEDNKRDFIIDSLDTKKKTDTLPNKIWRSFFYVNKLILCSGLSYPNRDDNTTNFILDCLKDLVYTKFNWKYQYHEEYKDMLYLDGDGYNKEIIIENTFLSKNKHSIILLTDIMYNDMGSHTDEDFYCYRNWVPETKFINLSGKRTCLVCGKALPSRAGGAQKICYQCIAKTNIRVKEKS